MMLEQKTNPGDTIHEWIVSLPLPPSIVQEKSSVDLTTKKVFKADLHFVRVAAPLQQPIRFGEVGPCAKTPSWRSVVDELPRGVQYEQAAAALVEHDLDQYGLMMSQGDEFPLHIIARTSRKEGEKVLDAKHQLFTSVQKCVDFFNLDGNAALLDKPLLEITGLQQSDGSLGTVYALLLGAASFLVDRRQLNKQYANTRLCISPELGPNDGFVSLVMHTHNGCGCAAKVPLAIDFGELHAPGKAGLGVHAKRFTNVLSMLVRRADVTDCSDRPDESSAEMKGETNAGTSEEPVKKKQKLSTDEALKNPDKTLPVAAAGEDAAGVAASTAGVLDLTADEVAPAAKVVPAAAPSELVPKAASSELVPKDMMNDASSHYWLYFRDLKPQQLAIGSPASKITNTKVPKGVLLVPFIKGKVAPTEDELPSGLMQFAFASNKELVIFQKSGTEGQLATLASVMAAENITKVWNHDLLPANIIKTKNQTVVFTPEKEERTKYDRLVAAAAEKQDIGFFWILIAVKDKLLPHGVGLCSKKQLIAKIGGTDL
jgi:hypothetical protein